MNGVLKLTVWGIAALGLAGAPSWAAAQAKIAYVNYSKLLDESPQAKAIAEAIRNEFAPRQRELQAKQQKLKSKEEQFQKDAATMTPEQRSRAEKELRDSARDFARDQAELQEDFNARRNEEVSRLQQTLISEVQSYAKAQNFDLVIADGVIYANNTVDITPAILSALQARSKTSQSQQGQQNKQ